MSVQFMKSTESLAITDAGSEKVKIRDKSFAPRVSSSEQQITQGLQRAISAFSIESYATGNQDTEKVRETIAQEMGVPPNQIFDDLKGLVTKLSAKLSSAENISGASLGSFSKIFSRLQKTVPSLVTNEEIAIQNQDLILQIYGLLHVIIQESTKLGGLIKPLDRAKDIFNEKLGIQDIGTSIAGGVEGDRGSLQPPTPATPATPAPLKLFAKLPKQITESGLEKAEQMRLSAVYELIETELDYVQDLKTILNLHRQQVKDLLGDNEANLIFSNVDQLLMANQILANKLIAKRDANLFISEVGDVLIDCADSFSVYCVYAANYPAAMKACARPEMKELLAKLMAHPDARGLSLESFLIKPVQRICKYPLLIRDLGNYTKKAGNEKDTELLKKAATLIEAVVTKVNEATRVAEEKMRILGLGSLIESSVPLNFEDKVFLRDGPIQRLEKNGKQKERYLILYTDLLLICSPIIRVPPVRGPTKYELENGYSLAELTLNLTAKDAIKVVKNNLIIGLNVISEEKDLILFMTNTQEEYTKWMDLFQASFKDITEEHRSAVRSMEAQQRAFERQTMGPDMFRSTMEKRKQGFKTAGLSVVAAKRAIGRLQSSGFNAEQEPDVVKLNGVVYKRTLSTLGIPYYFCSQTKESMWKLPESEEELDSKQLSILSKLGGGDDANSRLSIAGGGITSAEMDPSMLETVKGFPNWRKVLREGDSPYYFHTISQETSWDPPTSN